MSPGLLRRGLSAGGRYVVNTLRRVRDAIGIGIGMALGTAICEPKLRVGRFRHDGVCDRCDDPCGRSFRDKLDFPLDDLSPEASTTREKLRAMWNAEYKRYCLGCVAILEAESTEETTTHE